MCVRARECVRAYKKHFYRLLIFKNLIYVFNLTCHSSTQNTAAYLTKVSGRPVENQRVISLLRNELLEYKKFVSEILIASDLTLGFLAESLDASSFRTASKKISYLAVSRLKEHFLWMIVWWLNPERVLLLWRMACEIAAVANPFPEISSSGTEQCYIVYPSARPDLRIWIHH
jgi:hypothetical protein